MREALITEFGASPAREDNAAFIQQAIDSLPGGRVVIPPGVYRSSGLRLKSGLQLILESGAVLKASADLSRYPVRGMFDSGTKEMRTFLSAEGCADLSIQGPGTIDASGDAFFDFSFTDEDRALYGDGVRETPARCRERLSHPIYFSDCENVRLRELTIVNSPCWTVTLNRCRGVKIRDVDNSTGMRIPNSDGVHISGSQDVEITGCTLRCGDDCVAVTSILDSSAVSQNVLISHCILSSSSSAIRVGHLDARVENVLISGCIIENANRGIAIFAGDGGAVEAVKVSGCILRTRILEGGWWGKGEAVVVCSKNSSGRISDVSFRDLTVETENQLIFAGNVENCTLDGCSIRIKDSPRRKFARQYDIAPNGTLDRKNDFQGPFCIDLDQNCVLRVNGEPAE